MNNDNGFDLLIVVVFAMSPQLGGLGPKSKDLVIYFHLGEGDSLPKVHLRALNTRSESLLFRYKIGQIKNPTGKYTMEISKLKHLQR